MDAWATVGCSEGMFVYNRVELEGVGASAVQVSRTRDEFSWLGAVFIIGWQLTLGELRLAHVVYLGRIESR